MKKIRILFMIILFGAPLVVLLRFNANNVNGSYDYRYYGRTIRPVKP